MPGSASVRVASMRRQSLSIARESKSSLDKVLTPLQVWTCFLTRAWKARRNSWHVRVQICVLPSHAGPWFASQSDNTSLAATPQTLVAGVSWIAFVSLSSDSSWMRHVEVVKPQISPSRSLKFDSLIVQRGLVSS